MGTSFKTFKEQTGDNPKLKKLFWWCFSQHRIKKLLLLDWGNWHSKWGGQWPLVCRVHLQEDNSLWPLLPSAQRSVTIEYFLRKYEWTLTDKWIKDKGFEKYDNHDHVIILLFTLSIIYFFGFLGHSKQGWKCKFCKLNFHNGCKNKVMKICLKFLNL